MDKAEFDKLKTGLGTMPMEQVDQRAMDAMDQFFAAQAPVLSARKPTETACHAFREAAMTAQQWMDLKILKVEGMVKAGEFPRDGLESYKGAIAAEAGVLESAAKAGHKKCDIYAAPTLKQ